MTKEILVYVEDDNILREVIEDELNEYYDAKVFVNPLEAATFIKENAGSVKVLLTDFVMPELNGLELIKQTKQMSTAIKCILLTGYCKSIGSDDEMDVADLVLEKNILHSIEELVEKIKAL